MEAHVVVEEAPRRGRKNNDEEKTRRHHVVVERTVSEPHPLTAETRAHVSQRLFGVAH